MKALLNAIEVGMKADSAFEYVGGQITCAVNGQIPDGWQGHMIVISPNRQSPNEYPAGLPNHTALTLTVYCYAEFYGERIGLMGDEQYKGVLDMEQDVRDYLTPDGNADFEAFGGLASACFWKDSTYPEARQRNYEALNEVRIVFDYRN